MAFNIIIGGDLVPTKSNYSLFEEANVDSLVGEEILNILKKSDFSIFNLEVPLTDALNPIEKCGPNLAAPTSTLAGINKLNPRFFTLANNHILDQGNYGLFSTIKLLDKYDIAYAGAGKNIKEASKPYIYESQGCKVGIYCCAEHEFSIATNNEPGANPFDPFESLDEISSLKHECDYVIVLYHGGKEHYRYPSPYLQKVCRKIIEKGADIVVCQHSHCIGCKEEWKNGTIIYGQGNFLFDNSENEFWQTSLLIELSFSQNKSKPTIDFHPLKKDGNKVRLAVGFEKEDILNNFYNRSEDIKLNGFIEKQYMLFAEKMRISYLRTFTGCISSNFIFRVINKLSCGSFQKLFIKTIYKNKNFLALQNYIECEAHRELLVRGLKK